MNAKTKNKYFYYLRREYHDKFIDLKEIEEYLYSSKTKVLKYLTTDVKDTYDIVYNYNPIDDISVIDIKTSDYEKYMKLKSTRYDVLWSISKIHVED